MVVGGEIVLADDPMVVEPGTVPERHHERGQVGRLVAREPAQERTLPGPAPQRAQVLPEIGGEHQRQRHRQQDGEARRRGPADEGTQDQRADRGLDQHHAEVAQRRARIVR